MEREAKKREEIANSLKYLKDRDLDTILNIVRLARVAQEKDYRRLMLYPPLFYYNAGPYGYMMLTYDFNTGKFKKNRIEFTIKPLKIDEYFFTIGTTIFYRSGQQLISLDVARNESFLRRIYSPEIYKVADRELLIGRTREIIRFISTEPKASASADWETVLKIPEDIDISERMNVSVFKMVYKSSNKTVYIVKNNRGVYVISDRVILTEIVNGLTIQMTDSLILVRDIATWSYWLQTLKEDGKFSNILCSWKVSQWNVDKIIRLTDRTFIEISLRTDPRILEITESKDNKFAIEQYQNIPLKYSSIFVIDSDNFATNYDIWTRFKQFDGNYYRLYSTEMELPFDNIFPLEISKEERDKVQTFLSSSIKHLSKSLIRIVGNFI